MTDRFRKSSAFTLVELMISIALVVILILGINTVFKYTAQAVGQGQAINTAVRDSRSAQTTMASDFAALVPNGTGATDSAGIIIAAMAQPAYLNAADKATADGQTYSSGPAAGAEPLYVDINGDSKKGDTTVPGEVVSPATYNFRNHRLDTVSFFARNKFPRQTGNDGTYVDSLAGQEAWIWYGHLWLPTNDQSSQTNAFPALTNAVPSPTYPGIGISSSESTPATNPNNYFAAQFVLGRMPILLKTPAYNPVDGFNEILNSNNTPQEFNYLTSTQLLPANQNIRYLAPLQYGSASYINTAATNQQNDTWGTGAARSYLFQESRNDLAGTSIKTLQTQVANAVSAGNPYWWVNSTYAISSGTTAYAGTSSFLRFQTIPSPPKPLTAARLATAAPYFVPGCTQFIVEFAGDFLSQDNNPAHTSRAASPYTVQGDVIGLGSDGQIDYHMANGAKAINWYGLPRNTSGAATTSYANGDVVPVYDWLQTMRSQTSHAPASTIPVTNFEKVGPTRPAVNTDWSSTTSGNGLTLAEAHNGYICAFGPNDPAPSLIRITMTLNDSGGQLPDGQTYQFVFAVPPQ